MSDYDIEHQLWLAIPQEERSGSGLTEFQCDLCYEHIDASERTEVAELTVCDSCINKHYWSCSHCDTDWPNRIKPHVTNKGLTCEDCLSLDHETK
jgi:hypothetical protein